MASILLLSPMSSITELAPIVARDLGIELDIATSDDASVSNIIQAHDGVEIVVTRGGLAERARLIDDISVVEIAMSHNELLGNLSKLTGKGLRKIAVVSRANLFSGAGGDFDILGAKVAIRPQADEIAIKVAVRQLVTEGFEAIIGCRVAFETAVQLGVDAIFLESSEVSIRAALQEAMRLLEAKHSERLQAAQLATIIDSIDEAVIATDANRRIHFSNKNANRLFLNRSKNSTDFTSILNFLQSKEPEALIETENGAAIAKNSPIVRDGHHLGNVLTLQDASKIQESETRIRASLHKKGLYARYRFKDIVAESPNMKALIETAQKFSRHDANLLIHGETGTGKEVLAQSIHNFSPRKNGPFVSINIASIPSNLLESELFGYVDGAFTGARKGGKAGLFELAHNGTLFLDEIGEMAPEMQSRLLRVLQEKEIMRIGDDKIIPVDVRVISATHRNLANEIDKGNFRQDLYYRIHVFGIHIPPLRQRQNDIPLIFEHYLRMFTKHLGIRPQLKRSAIEALKTHLWPGNIRQLRNVAEVVSYSENEQISAEQIREALGDTNSLPPSASKFISIPNTGDLKTMETAIINTLLATNTPEDVCDRLGISKVTLWRKTKAHA